MKTTSLYLAYAGSGKTWCGLKYGNVKDFDEMPYKWVFNEYGAKLPIEKQKAYPHRTKNPDYPRNYLRAIKDSLNFYDVVLVPLDLDSLKLIMGAGIMPTLVYPPPHRRKQRRIFAKVQKSRQ